MAAKKRAMKTTEQQQIQPPAKQYQQRNYERMTMSQPKDLAAAMRAEAERRGVTVSEWIGELIIAELPAKVRKSLKPRPALGRPFKAAAPQPSAESLVPILAPKPSAGPRARKPSAGPRPKA